MAVTREGLAAMPPSPAQTFPQASSMQKEMRRDTNPASERTKKQFAEEVVSQFEGPLSISKLLNMSSGLQDQFREKLRESDMCMLPSFNHTLPTGHETGNILALDIGGSTFRVALVKLNGKLSGGKAMEIKGLQCHFIDNSVRALKGRQFFQWIAQRIRQALDSYGEGLGRGDEVLPMGVAWSFPIK